MIEAIFDQCVHLLVFLADHLGITYKEINVWIFVFIWPMLTFVLIGLVILQQRRIRSLLREVRALRESSSSK
ncbi:MAG: hypothetical protein DRI48_10540 [Chloroflexi bacterium]|nr:MAG: hypothetical protein DRI48_10540 [Chloroflexota bacterium]